MDTPQCSLLRKDELSLALASLAALMLAGGSLDQDYCCMNIPFIPCAGLGDIAPSSETVHPQRPAGTVGRLCCRILSGQLGSIMHPVYKQQTILGRELSLEWKPLLQILTQDHAHCIIWLGSTFAEPTTTQPVIASQVPCWPWILLMTEPLRKGISVCILTWIFREFDTQKVPFR